MPNWVPFHEELRQGAKRGIPRAVRFIFLELAMECRKGRGSVRLPVGMDDADAVHDLLGGRRSEVEEALQVLTAVLPGEDGGQPMVVLEGPERARTLRIPCWAKWNHNKEAPGASTERVQRLRDRRKQSQVLTDDETVVTSVSETAGNVSGTVGNDPIVQVQEREISTEPLERGSETSMPPGAPHARGEGGAASDPERPLPGLTTDQVAGVLGQEVFEPLFQDGWLDDLTLRLSEAGIRVEDVRIAAEDFALKRTGDGLHGKRLLTAFVGFAATEKRNRQAIAAKERPLDEAERVAAEIWRELWSKAHGGAHYAECAKDPDRIRAIAARAKARASALGNVVRGREVLRHYFARYLAIDDKSLVKKRYPLSLLDAHMPAIGEYEPPRPKPAPLPMGEATHAGAPVSKEPLPDLTAMFEEQRQKSNGQLVARARA